MESVFDIHQNRMNFKIILKLVFKLKRKLLNLISFYFSILNSNFLKFWILNFKFPNSEFLIQDFLQNLGILATFFLQRAILFLFSNSSINNTLSLSIVLKLIQETFDITIAQRSPSNSKSYISDLKIAAPLRLKCEFLRVATHRVALRGAATQRTTQHDVERRDATQRNAARLVALGSWLMARGFWLVACGSWFVVRPGIYPSVFVCPFISLMNGQTFVGLQDGHIPGQTTNHEPRATCHEPRALPRCVAWRCVASLYVVLRCALCCGASQRHAMRCDTEKLAL